MWIGALGLLGLVIFLAHRTNKSTTTQGAQALPPDTSVASSGVGGPMSPATAGGTALLGRANKLRVFTNARNAKLAGRAKKFPPVQQGVYTFQAGPTDQQRAVATQEKAPPVGNGIPMGAKGLWTKL